MNNDLISREALKEAIKEDLAEGDNSVNLEYCNAMETALDIIDNAPSVNPCDNCDLYFKATTKEIDRWYKKEEQKGGAE